MDWLLNIQEYSVPRQATYETPVFSFCKLQSPTHVLYFYLSTKQKEMPPMWNAWRILKGIRSDLCANVSM